MSFRNVNHQERYAIFVLFIKLVEGRSLLPEGRSGITAKDQHDRLLPIQFRKLYRSAPVYFHEIEIRRGITRIQTATASVQPHGFKRETQENNRRRYFGHNFANGFRRLAHDPPYEAAEAKIKDGHGKKTT